MSERSRVFLATAIGSLIGGSLGTLLSPLLAVLGFLGGAASGYLLYDMPEVIASIPEAAKSTTEWRLTRRKKGIFWSFLLPELKLNIAIMVNITLLMATLLPFMPEGITTGALAALMAAITILTGPLSFGIAIRGTAIWDSEPEKRWEYLYHRNQSEKGAHNLNPLVYLPQFAKWVGRGVYYLFTLLKGKAPSFAWHLITLIHSDVRQVCGVGAFIGSVPVYFLASTITGALIGAGIGGVIGVLYYEYIAIPVFGLNPAENGT